MKSDTSATPRESSRLISVRSRLAVAGVILYIVTAHLAGGLNPDSAVELRRLTVS